MTGYHDGTTTPEKVKQLATEHAVLPRIALIGLFGSEEKPAALIRWNSGQTRRIQIGDKAAGGIVAAIGHDQVVIAKRGHTTLLKMPTT